MECGIVGMPLAGKSMLFSILTGVEPSLTGSRDPRRGVAKLADERLDALTAVYNSRKRVPATVEYLDIPGVAVKEGTRELYPGGYLSALRTVSMLAVVVRSFESPEIPHPRGSIDPVRDAQEAMSEFIFNDLVTVENRLAKAKKLQDSDSKKEAELLDRCWESLEYETPLRELDFTTDETKILRSFSFLSLKPLLVVLNIGEESAGDIDNLLANLTEKLGNPVNVGTVAVAAGIEAEIGSLEPEDQEMFLADLGFEGSTLDRIVKATFDLLGMITFLTSSETESRAWAIPRGSTAVQAAAAIHNDLARGFIRAETCRWDDLVAVGGALPKLREQGKLRLEGKDYIVQDGDTMHIRFNV